MSIGLLDLNDSNVQLWHRDTHVQSPGYALLRGGEYLFGSAARAGARVQPRDINTRYWWQLSTEALQPALGPARHTGDLAHAHLNELYREAQQPSEVLLAVPGSMQREQLALLLGIVQQCPFDAVGLVNRSVALGSLYAGSARLFHLEIQLHQALVSELATADATVHLQRSITLPGCGLLQVQERLVEIIAAAFVRQTRFDPRRKAASEQQLYDALPAALRRLQAGNETNLDVGGYQARINRNDLRSAGQRLFDSARDACGPVQPNDHVIADPLAALLPGLDALFGQITIAEDDAIHRALQLQQEHLVQRGEGLSLVTALPLLGQSAQPAVPPPQTAARSTVDVPAANTPELTPTHLLRAHVAHPLDADGTPLEQGWELVRGADGWQLQGSGNGASVNGTPYRQEQILGSGDEITIAGGEALLLIAVAS